LKQIANDPDYLAEWQERSDSKIETPHPKGLGDGAAGAGTAGHNEPITVDITLREREVKPLESSA
jgi:hypothetical protein